MTPWLKRVRAALAPKGYDVECELASGGMGTVFLARHHGLDRFVAVKIIRPELHTALGAERFRQEAKILASFSHPNIVPIHDASEGDGLPYYVMDYLAGETLETRLLQGPLPIDEARKLGRDLLAALGAAHAKGVVHRDVKPSNVFLIDGRAMLVDFGVAKVGPAAAHVGAAALTGPGAVLGTLDYMPPEQAAGGEVTPRTDLCAAGMVLYEALVQRHWSWDRAERADWSGVPREIAKVLRRALAWAPEDRWPDATAFRRALWRTRTRRYVRRTVVLGVLGLTLGWLVKGAVTPSPPARSLSDLAILPFRVQASTDTMLGRDLARLAAVHMEGLEEHGIALTPRERAFAWWDSSRGDPVALAREAPGHLGTKRWVQGVVSERAGKVDVRVTVFDADGHSQESAPIHGTTADPATLGFAIGTEIVRTARPDLLPWFRPVGGLSNATVEALREFQRGEDAFQREAWQTAEGHYRKALVVDSSLGYARWRLTLAQYWSRRGPGQEMLDRLYREHVRELSELDRELLGAMRGPAGGPRLRAFDRATRQFPSSAMAPMLYGWELLHRGALVGVPLDSAATVLRVAAARNPSLGQAYTGLAWVWIRLGQRDSAQRALDHLSAITAGRRDLDLDLPALLRMAFAGRFSGGQDNTAAPQSTKGLAQAFRFALSFDIPGTELSLGRLLSEAPAAPTEVRADGHEGEGLALLALGRGSSALAQLDSAAALYRTQEAHFQAIEWRVVPGALGLPVVPYRAVEAGRAALRGRAAGASPDLRAAWVMALDGFARHDTLGAAGWAAAVRRHIGSDSTAWRLDQLLRALRAATQGDELAAIAISDSLSPAHDEHRGGDPFVRSVLHIKRAEWYERLGRPAEADREWLWYENADIDGWPTGEAQAGEVDWVLGVYARERRAALALARGDARRSCGYLRRVLELWAGADSVMSDLVGRTRRLSDRCGP